MYKNYQKEDWAITKKRKDVFHVLKMCSLSVVYKMCILTTRWRPVSEVNGVLIAISVRMLVTAGESQFCSITKFTPQDAWYFAPLHFLRAR